MKKIILFSIFLQNFVFSQTSPFSCAFVPNGVTTNAQINVTPTLEQPCIETSPGASVNTRNIGQTNFFATGNFEANELLGTNGGEITLNPGFSTQNQTPTKSFHAKIIDVSENRVAPVIMNHSVSSTIKTEEKLEIGVRFIDPLARQALNNFLNSTVGQPTLNPFVDWEVRVYAVFKHISLNPNPSVFPPSQQTNSAIQPDAIVDGFFTKDYNSWAPETLPVPAAYPSGYTNQEYSTLLGGYNEIASDYPFRIRWSPPQVGVWSCQVFYVLKSGFATSGEIGSIPFYFKVTQGGALVMKVGENKRFLARRNTSLSGNVSFYPVGCHAYPNDTVFDPQLAAYQRYYNPAINALALAGTLYQDRVDSPYFMKKWRNKINQMVDGGANFIGLLSTPTAFDIEWEIPGEYSKRMDRAYELDKFFELAENRGFYYYYRPTLQSIFQTGAGSYYIKWQGDQINSSVTQSPERYCYRDLLQQSNGLGYDQPTVNFLTDPLCKKYFKQRLRYLIARYSYSTSMGMFELFGELNQVGDNSVVATTSPYNSNSQPYEDWAIEMADYIKTFHNAKRRILTNTFAGNDAGPTGSGCINDDTYTSPSFDVAGRNVYDFAAPSFGDQLKAVASYYANDKNPLEGATTSWYATQGIFDNVFPNRKPVTLPECGPVNASCDPNHVELLRSLLQRPFSGVAMSMDWEAFKYPEVFPYFGYLNTFLSQFNLQSSANNQGNWHPGATNLESNGEWHYNENYADWMYGQSDSDPSPNTENFIHRRADIAYLRRGDRKMAIGLISNKTFNIRNAGTCLNDSIFGDNFRGDDESINEGSRARWNIPANCADPSTFEIEGEQIRIAGMRLGNYDFEYFRVNNPLVPVHYSDYAGFGYTKALQIEMVPNLYQYMYFFIARRNVGGKSLEESDTLEINEEEMLSELEDDIQPNIFNPVIYPNPAHSSISIANLEYYKGGSVTLMKVDGSILSTYKIINSNFSIDISTLSSGYYQIKITNFNSESYVLPFVKN